jgi:hypothetical protein
MPALDRFVAGFVALFRRRRAEQELDAELQQFLDMAIEDKMRAGISRESATRAARMALGKRNRGQGPRARRRLGQHPRDHPSLALGLADPAQAMCS